MRSWSVQPNLSLSTQRLTSFLWRVIYISIVVRQTMAIADVRTFHCCASNNGMLTSVLSIVCLSTQRLTSFLTTYGAHINRLCVESDLRQIMFWIRTRYPDHHQNLMEWSLGSRLPSHNISFKSVHNFLSNPANRQTNRQTNTQTNGDEYITFAQLRWRM